MKDFDLIELCCGSSALSLHMMGSKKSIVPYQGSKWKFRKAISNLIESLGYIGAPKRIQLEDASFWPIVLDQIMSNRAAVLIELERLNELEPRKAYDAIHKFSASKNQAIATAEFLFLQRLAFSGKAVSCLNNTWKSPGYNKSSAEGKAATDSFGKINPLIPSLIKTVKALPQTSIDLKVYRRAIIKPTDPVTNTIVYIDPPYRDTTRYPDGSLSRADLVEIASEWLSLGASVIISEAEPISELGWSHMEIYPGNKKKSPFKGKHREFLTYKKSI